MGRQFIDTLNPLQPSWNPSQISRAIPKAGGAALSGLRSGLGIRKDGLYATQCVHIYASDPALNPLMDGHMLMFDTIGFDSNGFSNGQIIDQLIVPVAMAGVYLLVVQADTNQSVNNAAQGLTLLVNGTMGIGKSEVKQQGTTGSSINLVAVWRLDDGDIVQARYQDDASDPNAYLKVVEPGTPSLALVRIGG